MNLSDKKVLLLFSMAVSIIIFSSFVEKDFLAIAKNFLQLLNEDKFDDAAKLTTSDFKVNYLYTGGEKSKISFFSKSKMKTGLHPVTIADSSKVNSEKIILYVHSTSDLNTYAHLPVMRYRYTFSFASDSIKSLSIDSMPGYNDSLKVNDRRWKYFERWAQVKYPGINITYIKLQYSDSLAGLIRNYDGELKKKNNKK